MKKMTQQNHTKDGLKKAKGMVFFVNWPLQCSHCIKGSSIFMKHKMD